VWHLWREACRVEPADPESVITELEAACVESYIAQEGVVSIREFWNILSEIKLRGSMSRAQFEKGIKYVVQDGNSSDEDLIDCEALCRYTVRMGRAFNSLLQEKRISDDKQYAILKNNLKKELCAMMNVMDAMELENKETKKGYDGTTARSKAELVPRFEKVMRRMDADGDGKLTRQEFKVSLKRLHFKDEKLWSIRMVRRLFDDLDRDRDGLLSVREFSAMIQDKEFTTDDRKRREERDGSG
jgi:Ca2+-binding EF-hand superfamily protein